MNMPCCLATPKRAIKSSKTPYLVDTIPFWSNSPRSHKSSLQWNRWKKTNHKSRNRRRWYRHLWKQGGSRLQWFPCPWGGGDLERDVSNGFRCCRCTTQMLEKGFHSVEWVVVLRESQRLVIIGDIYTWCEVCCEEGARPVFPQLEDYDVFINMIGCRARMYRNRLLVEFEDVDDYIIKFIHSVIRQNRSCTQNLYDGIG